MLTIQQCTSCADSQHKNSTVAQKLSVHVDLLKISSCTLHRRCASVVQNLAQFEPKNSTNVLAASKLGLGSGGLVLTGVL